MKIKNIIIDSSFFNKEDKTDLLLKFDKPIKNVTKMSLKDIEYPKDNYNISSHYGNNKLILRNYKKKHQIINVTLNEEKIEFEINSSKKLKFSNKNDTSGILMEYVYKIYNSDLLYNNINKFQLTNSKSVDFVYSQTYNTSLLDNYLSLSGKYLFEYSDKILEIKSGFYDIKKLVNILDINLRKLNVSGVFQEKNKLKIIPNYRSIVYDDISKRVNFIFENISGHYLVKRGGEQYNDLLYMLGFTKLNSPLPSNPNEYIDYPYFPSKNRKSYYFDYLTGMVSISGNTNFLFQRPILSDCKKSQIIDFTSYNLGSNSRLGISGLNPNNDYYIIQSDSQPQLTTMNTIFLQINDYNLYNQINIPKNKFINHNLSVNNFYSILINPIFYKINLKNYKSDGMNYNTIVDEQVDYDSVRNKIKNNEQLYYRELEILYRTYILEKQINLGKFAKIKDKKIIKNTIMKFINTINNNYSNEVYKNYFGELEHFSLQLYDKYLRFQEDELIYKKLVENEVPQLLETYKFHKQVNISHLHIKFFNIYNQAPYKSAFNYVLDLEFK